MSSINTAKAERFIRMLLDPEMFGHAVSAEVRDEARAVLGMKSPVETKTNSSKINLPEGCTYGKLEDWEEFQNV